MKHFLVATLLLASGLLVLAQSPGDVVYVVQVDDDGRPQGPDGGPMSPFMGRPLLDNHLSTVKSLLSSIFDGGQPDESTFPSSPFLSKAFGRDMDNDAPGFRFQSPLSRTFAPSSQFANMVNSLINRVVTQNAGQGYNGEDREDEPDSPVARPQPRAQPRERPCLPDARRLCARSRMHPMAVLECLRSFQPHLSPQCEAWLVSKGLAEPLPEAAAPAAEQTQEESVPESSEPEGAQAISEEPDLQHPDHSQLEQPQEQPPSPPQDVDQDEPRASPGPQQIEEAVISNSASSAPTQPAVMLASKNVAKPAPPKAQGSPSHFGAILFGALCGALVVFSVLGLLGYRRRIQRKKRTTSTVTEAHATTLSMPVLSMVEQRV